MNLKFNFELMGGVAQSSAKVINFYIHNIQNEPKYIKVDGEKIEVKWNSDTKTLTLPINWKTSIKKEIKIKLKR
jgi:hypothetical protein